MVPQDSEKSELPSLKIMNIIEIQAKRIIRYVDNETSFILDKRRAADKHISSAHNETNLKNTAKLTQIIGDYYDFTPRELLLAYVAGSLHDIVRSAREGESTDEKESASIAKDTLKKFKSKLVFWTTKPEIEAVSYAIEDHGKAPKFFEQQITRNQTPTDLPTRIHTALFVADKMTANGYDALRRRPSFVAGERLDIGELKEFGFDFHKDKDRALVVAAESAVRLGFINPQFMYPDRLQAIVRPLYEVQREFVRGVYKALSFDNKKVAQLLLGSDPDSGEERKRDGKSIAEIRKLDAPSDVDKLAELLAERTGISDESIENIPETTAAAALETIRFFSSNYATDLDELTKRWNPVTIKGQEWRDGMLTLVE